MRVAPLVRNKLAGAYRRVVAQKWFQNVVKRSIVTREELIHQEATRCLWFDAEECFEIEAPYSLKPLPEEIKAVLGEHRIGRPFVCEVSNIELVGPEAVAVTRENEYVFEESLGSIELHVRSLLKAIANGNPPRRSSGDGGPHIETAVSLVGPWCRGYYHWFSDYLLRLEGVEHYVDETGREPTLIVPPNPPGWMETSLKFAGFDGFERQEWSGSRLTVGSLVVPSLRRETDLTKPEKGFVFSPRAYRWLGNRIRSNVEPHGESTKIFISREKAEERHVVNQEEVMDVLCDRGFDTYVLEEMNFREQVRLFEAAEIVVAPTGAGLTNMIYGDALDIVTLFGAVVNPCYPTLAESLGFENVIVTCEPKGLDMYVDPEKIIEAIDQL
jgi:hypothetical protein